MKDNVIRLPLTEVDGDTNIFDFTDVNPETMDKVFDLMNFLSNRDELIVKFTPDVEKFLENEEIFSNTAYKRSYDEAFTDFISGLIRDEVVDHFNFTPEETVLLTDSDFLDLLTEGYFFNKDNYKRS